MKFLVALLIMFLVSFSGFSDTITLKNGDVVTGKVIKSINDTTIIVVTKKGKLEIPTYTIASIVYSKTEASSTQYLRMGGTRQQLGGLPIFGH